MNDLSIGRIEPLFPETDGAPKKTEKPSSTPFAEYVQRSMEEVNRKMLTADGAINDLATGKSKDIHNTMIDMQKAEISFELVLQIRNKLMSAYDEIRRMSI